MNYDIMLINATSGVSNQWVDKTEVVVREGVSEDMFQFHGKINFSSPLIIQLSSIDSLPLWCSVWSHDVTAKTTRTCPHLANS